MNALIFLVNSALLFLASMVAWLLTPMVMIPLWEKGLYFCLFMLFLKYAVEFVRNLQSKQGPSKAYWIFGLLWWGITLIFLWDIWTVYPDSTKFIRMYENEGQRYYLFEDQRQAERGAIIRQRKGWAPFYTTVLVLPGVWPYDIMLMPGPGKVEFIWPEGRYELPVN